MRRTDRLLGILLYLSDGRTVSASELAERFEVSIRTIYRDIDALGELGVPIYSESGRAGGYQLIEGYFLPPVMFSEGEAISIILGQTLLRSIKSHPFSDDLESAEAKLLAALPLHLKTRLRDARRIIGFESVAPDAFHLERVGGTAADDEPIILEREQMAIDQFLTAILDGHEIVMQYRSPYRSDGPREYEASPLGMFWDRNCWYLVGRLVSDEPEVRIWRADRVLRIRSLPGQRCERGPFEIQDYLERAWLTHAMDDWRESHPVRILLTPEQAERLKGDWYYKSAHFETRSDGRVLMTFGQNRSDIVLELVRWLGPGAELLEPLEWREQLQSELETMVRSYL